MTKKELSQLYYLGKEIAIMQELLIQLQTTAESTTTQVTGMPSTSGKKDKVGKVAAEIADARTILVQKTKQYCHEIQRLIRFIEGIDDSLIRQIMILRYVKFLSWEDVAKHIGGGNTADSVRKQVDRYLKNVF